MKKNSAAGIGKYRLVVIANNRDKVIYSVVSPKLLMMVAERGRNIFIVTGVTGAVAPTGFFAQS